MSINVCYTHHGHSKQLEHTRISKWKREQIATSLQQGVSKQRILNDIRKKQLANVAMILGVTTWLQKRISTTLRNLLGWTLFTDIWMIK